VLARADEEFVIGRAKGPQRRHEPRGFEQIGFPLAVGADEKMLPPGKIECGKAHVAKMPKRELTQAHGGRREVSE